MKKNIAYLRVSTAEQDAENQRHEILELANDEGLGRVDFVEETVTGKKSWRDRKLGEILDTMTMGDVLLTAELSRLGRSVLEIFEILSVSSRAGIMVLAVRNKFRLDDSIQSKMVAMVYGLAAEIEADLIRERTTAALDARKRMLKDKGFFISKAGNRVTSLGRPRGQGRSKLDPHHDQIVESLNRGIPRVRVAEDLGCSESNLRHWLRQRGLSKVGKR